MRHELAELMKVVEQMPPEMAREVLNFALFLQRKQEQAAASETVEEGRRASAIWRESQLESRL